MYPESPGFPTEVELPGAYTSAQVRKFIYGCVALGPRANAHGSVQLCDSKLTVEACFPPSRFRCNRIPHRSCESSLRMVNGLLRLFSLMKFYQRKILVRASPEGASDNSPGRSALGTKSDNLTSPAGA